MFAFLFLCCALLEKEDSLQILHVLSHFVQLKSVLLISCVTWINQQQFVDSVETGRVKGQGGCNSWRLQHDSGGRFQRPDLSFLKNKILEEDTSGYLCKATLVQQFETVYVTRLIETSCLFRFYNQLTFMTWLAWPLFLDKCFGDKCLILEGLSLSKCLGDVSDLRRAFSEQMLWR